jgi:hypothetical protein
MQAFLVYILKKNLMIEAPKITEEQQKQFRHEFIKMIEEYEGQHELEAFRNEWDGAVHFQIIDDHTVFVNIAGENKLPQLLKEKTRSMRDRFNEGHYHQTV